MRYELNGVQWQRFWKKVGFDVPTKCWTWRGGRMVNGYGRYGQILAHRIMYSLWYGDIPEATPWVLHECDNRICVNPYHLFLGTVLDNNADRVAKGREGIHVSLGEKNGLSKLTEDAVREIRARWANGEAQTSIAKDFGVKNTNICSIVHGKTWRHISEALSGDSPELPCVQLSD